MKSWSQLILQKVPDKISASQFLLVLLTLDSNLYHIFYTISFYTIIVQKNRTLFHKLFPPLSHRNVALSFFPFILASSLMQCYSIVNNFSGGNTMIDKKLIPVKGLKKEPFSGSHFGMRYYFCADDTKENFLVFVYPRMEWMLRFPGFWSSTMHAGISGTLFPKTRCISSIRLPNSKKSISSFLYFHYI